MTEEGNLSEEEKQALLEEEEQKKKEEEALLEELEEEEKRKKEELEYTDDDLRLLKEAEADQLKEWGFPQFESYEEMAKNFAKVLDEDKTAYPIVKKLATQLKTTPVEFMRAVEKRIKGQGKETEEESKEDVYDKRIRTLEQERGDVYLNIGFDKFQRRMLSKDTEISDELQPELTALLPAVVAGKTKEEIGKIPVATLFEKAYRLYLFELSEEKNPAKIIEKLSKYDRARLAKLKQLGVPIKKTSTKGYSKDDVEAYGEGITKL